MRSFCATVYKWSHGLHLGPELVAKSNTTAEQRDVSVVKSKTV